MKERGMKKWMAYKSLTSQGDYLNKMRNEKSLEERPLISESKAEEINNILSNYQGETVVMSAYLGGHVKVIEGQIEKIDPIYKTLEIKNMKISFKNIVEIK